MRTLTCLGILLSVAITPAQRILATRYGQLDWQYGTEMVPAGDVDRDGIADVMVCVRHQDSNGNPRFARVELLSGRDLRLLRTFQETTFELFGESCSGGSDFNADGTPDIVIGIPGRRVGTTSGAVALYSGADGTLLGTITPPSSSEQFGYAVLALPDVDADGAGDVALLDQRGATRFYSGRTRALIRTGLGPATFESSRMPRLGLAGDVDNDGMQDVLVGDPDGGTPRNMGRVYVISARTGATLRNVFGTPGNLEELGAVIAGGADLDGDSHADFVAVARVARNPVTGSRGGTVVAYSGRTGTLLFQLWSPFRDDTFFGYGLSLVADCNADGAPDLAVGRSNLNDPPRGDAGSVLIYSSRSRALLAEVPGVGWPGWFGWRIVRVGDADGDGLDDLAIAAPYESALAQSQGVVRLLSSRILAQVVAVGTGCGGGPIVPSLRATRPVLGQNFTLYGYDVMAPGVVLFGPPASMPLNLGVVGCDFFVDPGGFTPLLVVPSAGNWSLPLPLPGAAFLAGIEIAMQAVHGPTVGPLGVDVTNGLRLRFGW